MRHRVSCANVRNQTTGTARRRKKGTEGLAELKEQHRQSTQHARGELEELKKQHKHSADASLKELEGLQSTNHELDTLNTRLHNSKHNRGLEGVDSQEEELLELQPGGPTAHSSDKLHVLNERSMGRGASVCMCVNWMVTMPNSIGMEIAKVTLTPSPVWCVG